MFHINLAVFPWSQHARSTHLRAVLCQQTHLSIQTNFVIHTIYTCIEPSTLYDFMDTQVWALINLKGCYDGCSPMSGICFTAEDAQLSTNSAAAWLFVLLDATDAAAAAATAAAEAKSVMLNTNWRQPNLI